MGQDISKVAFEPADFARFSEHLQAEMELLKQWFDEDKFCDDALQTGLELEAWLIGKDGLPVADNTLFLATLDRKWVVPELSKFNFEVNVSPQYLRGSGLRDMQTELSAIWKRCRSVAEKLDYRILSIGILPTVTDSMLCVANMSQKPRFAALNEQVLKLRGGKPVVLEIQGADHLQSEHYDLMLESAATSVQVHLKVPPRSSVRYYNASMIASALTVAIAANAPLLFGRRLWDDTRIAVFEQAVDTAGLKPRVSFGSNFLKESLFKCFEDNLRYHRILLPAKLEQPPALMPHVRMHNGTIWNWNRALIGFESDGRPHLRIEHRPMSASPTISDLFADATLYLGLVELLATSPTPPENQLSFQQTQDNFYAAARKGLQARIKWIDGRVETVAHLLRRDLAARAFAQADKLGIDSGYLELCQRVIDGRLETMQNGADWQRRKFSEYHGDLARLLLDYEAQQMSGLPVHTWD